MNQTFLIVICATIVIIILLIVAILISSLGNPHQMSSNCPLVFIHIPKTGGTTINEIAKVEGIKWRYNGDRRRYSCQCNTWHIPPNEKIRELNIPTFCVVRNPYERVISEYRFRNHFTSVESLNDYIACRIKNLESPECIDDCHWIPQHQYVTYCDHALKYENLKEDFDNLMIQYKLKMRMDIHRNKSEGKSFQISDISEENIKRINQYYRKDFEMFGYDMI